MDTFLSIIPGRTFVQMLYLQKNLVLPEVSSKGIA